MMWGGIHLILFMCLPCCLSFMCGEDCYFLIELSSHPCQSYGHKCISELSSIPRSMCLFLRQVHRLGYYSFTVTLKSGSVMEPTFLFLFSRVFGHSVSSTFPHEFSYQLVTFCGKAGWDFGKVGWDFVRDCTESW